MLELLDKVIKERLPKLLNNRQVWNSVHVTYYHPRVERLWVQIDQDHRLFLHRIYPCEDGEALYHPHPWPAAVRIMNGRYEMGIAGVNPHPTADFGTGRTEHPLPVPGKTWDAEYARTVLGPGSEYEMTNRHSWHYVRPLKAPSDSIMIVGPLHVPPVQMPSPPSEKQEPLSPERFDALMGEWHDRIDGPVACPCGWKGRHSELDCFRDEEGRPAESEFARCPECFDEDYGW